MQKIWKVSEEQALRYSDAFMKAIDLSDPIYKEMQDFAQQIRDKGGQPGISITKDRYFKVYRWEEPEFKGVPPFDPDSN